MAVTAEQEAARRSSIDAEYQEALYIHRGDGGMAMRYTATSTIAGGRNDNVTTPDEREYAARQAQDAEYKRVRRTTPFREVFHALAESATIVKGSVLRALSKKEKAGAQKTGAKQATERAGAPKGS